MNKKNVVECSSEQTEQIADYIISLRSNQQKWQFSQKNTHTHTRLEIGVMTRSFSVSREHVCRR